MSKVIGRQVHMLAEQAGSRTTYLHLKPISSGLLGAIGHASVAYEIVDGTPLLQDHFHACIHAGQACQVELKTLDLALHICPICTHNLLVRNSNKRWTRESRASIGSFQDMQAVSFLR